MEATSKVSLFIAFIFFSAFLNVLGQVKELEPERLTSNPCKVKTSCGDCIAADPKCAWCARENFTEASLGNTRCDLMNTLQFSCQHSLIYPNNSITQVTSNPLSRGGAQVKDVVQLAPQKIKLKLRPKDPFKLEVKFRQAEDYPVDLYYLMDLSKSMEDDKDKLASLGNLLALEMDKITRNFRLGFGSFVDKIVMPYVSTVPNKLLEPCTRCAAPYGFKNHMPLSGNTSRFATEVKNAQVSGNLDAPEGGFDAIMQAIVCNQEIMWREKSRKMLVFSTDAGFHYAGDGKLGGIITPNDGSCHLNKDGYYTESTTQDYPSLSQLRHKISEKKVNIIFAVTSGQVPVYTELSKNLEGAYTGQLANDSGNVVDLVRTQYDQITSEVEMKDNATSNVKVTYFSKCLGDKVEKTNICKGLRVGTEVEFTAEIEVTSCPKNAEDRKQIFHIYPVGLNEALVVELEMICECDCGEEEIDSPKCSGAGTYKCGVCNCYDNKFGRRCECGDKVAAQDDGSASCRMGNSTVECSGRGTCSCGVCHCYERTNTEEKVEGPYCECDNFSCDRGGGKLCSDRGTCVCGKCQCLSGWGGDACECMEGNSTCIPPPGTTGPVCSGKGKCVCGACQCEDRYSGPYCEECPTCAGKCAEYRACVQCQAFESGELKDNCTCSFKIDLKPEVKVEKANERLCVFKDEDDCKFTFVYGYDENNNPEVRVQDTKECPPPVNILMIVLGVIGGIVAIGLCLLLIWKLLTTIHDRREFAKFEKERQMAKWDTGENPIYKQATSTFKNPTYGGRQ